MIFLLLLVAYASLTLAEAQGPLPIPNHRAFAELLTAALYTNENECTSTVGVSMAFSLVYPSMTGDAKNQTGEVFGFPDNNALLAWNATETQLESRYQGNCSGAQCSWTEPTVSISNSIWIDSNTTLNASYSDIVQDYLKQIDFSDATAGEQVNTWVSNSTQGLIDSIVDSGPLTSIVLIAINAIYLKASWALPFQTYKTNQDAFYMSASRTATVTNDTLFMHQISLFPYSHEALPGFQVLQLPFIDEELSMIIVLPINDDNGTVSSTDLIETALPILREETKPVALALPKFKLESTYVDSLNRALQQIGVTAPFEGGLCVFENDCSTAIELIIQKTFISVDEEGVEAAAVTAGISKTAIPKYPEGSTLFLADHPFQFFIYDGTTNLILFEGRLGNPPAQDATSAELSGKHSDSDFWTSTFGVAPIVVNATGTTSSSRRGRFTLYGLSLLIVTMLGLQL